MTSLQQRSGLRHSNRPNPQKIVRAGEASIPGLVTLGYLHAAVEERAQGGVRRYGMRLAKAMAQLEDVAVLEVDLAVGPSELDNLRRIRRAVRQLQSADVVHMQYSPYLWQKGIGWRSVLRLGLFLLLCRRPVVCSIHDLVAWPEQKPSSGAWVRRLVNLLRRLKPRYLPIFVTHQLLLRLSRLRFVCSQWEADRLQASGGPTPAIVPHYVETAAAMPDRFSARRRLAIDPDVEVITLQGFIFPRKGHDVLVEAMPLVRADRLLIFAGSPSSDVQEGWLRDLQTRARELGVADRLRITGYLSDEDMALYLAATDLAVCPFRTMSASGSLSTWIAAEKPVLASRLPQMEEYNRLVPDAIELVRPGDAAALAAAIERHFSQENRSNDGVRALKQLLSIDHIAERHNQAIRLMLADRRA